MTLPELTTGGDLPVGRWTCTLEDLTPFHRLPDETVRARVWSDYIVLLEAVRQATGSVAACWLGGSYFSDKEDPGDVDCLFVVRKERVEEILELGGDAAQLLVLVAGSQVRDTLHLSVDTYLLQWWPRPGTNRGTDVRRRGYLEDRGYWDDFWLRSRNQDIARTKFPSRGYLEVIVDGYN